MISRLLNEIGTQRPGAIYKIADNNLINPVTNISNYWYETYDKE